MERTLALIKPDGVERNLIGKIITFYENAGLKVVALRMEHVNKEFASKHYGEHIGKGYYEELITFITRSPLCALILEGNNAVEVVRQTNGATDPKDAKEGTIRGSYGTDKTQNCVHASDSIENAENEISLWFPNN